MATYMMFDTCQLYVGKFDKGDLQNVVNSAMCIDYAQPMKACFDYVTLVM